MTRHPHPNPEAMETPGAMYLVLELMQGGDLASRHSPRHPPCLHPPRLPPYMVIPDPAPHPDSHRSLVALPGGGWTRVPYPRGR